MKIAEGTSVRIDYTVLTEDGELVESKEISYEHGKTPMRRDIMEALEGQEEGHTAEIKVANFFGPRDDTDVKTVPRGSLPKDLKLEIGKRLEATTEKGKVVKLTVLDFNDKEVLLDGNHPLAGKTIVVRLKVRAVSQPPPLPPS